MKIFVIALCAILATTNASVIDSDQWSYIDGQRIPNRPSNLFREPSDRVIINPVANNLKGEPLLVSSRNGLVSSNNADVVNSNQEPELLIAGRHNPVTGARIVPIVEQGNVRSELPADVNAQVPSIVEIDRDIAVPVDQLGRRSPVGNVGLNDRRGLHQNERNILSYPVHERLDERVPVLSRNNERYISTPANPIGQAERAQFENELNERIRSQVQRDILSSNLRAERPLVSNVAVASGNEWDVTPISTVWNPRRYSLERVGLNRGRGLQGLLHAEKEILSSLVGCGRPLNKGPLSIAQIELAGEANQINVRALLENVGYVINRVFGGLSQIEREILISSLSSRRSTNEPIDRLAETEREIESQIADQVYLLIRKISLQHGLIYERFLFGLSPVEREIICASLGRQLIENLPEGRSGEILRNIASPVADQIHGLGRRVQSGGYVNDRDLSGLSPVERNILSSQIVAERSPINNILLNSLARRALLESGLINERVLSGISPADRNILEEQLESILPRRSLPYSSLVQNNILREQLEGIVPIRSILNSYGRFPVERNILGRNVDTASRAANDNTEWRSQRIESLPYSQLDELSAPIRSQVPVQRRVPIASQIGASSGTWNDLAWVRNEATGRPVWGRSVVAERGQNYGRQL